MNLSPISLLPALVGLENFCSAAGYLADASVIKAAVKYGAAKLKAGNVSVITQSNVMRGAWHNVVQAGDVGCRRVNDPIHIQAVGVEVAAHRSSWNSDMVELP